MKVETRILLALVAMAIICFSGIWTLGYITSKTHLSSDKECDGIEAYYNQNLKHIIEIRNIAKDESSPEVRFALSNYRLDLLQLLSRILDDYEEACGDLDKEVRRSIEEERVAIDKQKREAVATSRNKK